MPIALADCACRSCLPMALAGRTCRLRLLIAPADCATQKNPFNLVVPQKDVLMQSFILKYQALITTVELGSISRAAAKLNYSQSGISRMIAELEQEFNLRLLERSRAGVALTQEGAALYALIQAVCQAQDAVDQKVHALTGTVTGSLKIATFSSVATHILPRLLQEYVAAYPQVEIELMMGDYSEIEKWVREGSADLGFLPYPPKGNARNIIFKELTQDELLAVVSRTHDLAAHTSVTLKELADQPFLLLERRDDDEITPLFKAQKLTPQVRLATWDDYAIMSMVESGLGNSILPALILQKTTYKIATKHLRPRAFRTIGLIHRTQLSSLAALKFIQLVQANFEHKAY